MREFLVLILALILPGSAAAAAGNGGTPTTTPPTVSTCDQGAILLDLGSEWDVDASNRPIELDVVDYDTEDPTTVVLADIENASIEIDGIGPIEVGETITIGPGETVLGTLLMSADTVIITLSAFGANNSSCVIRKEITQ